MGPRFLREATDDSPKDPKTAGLSPFVAALCQHGGVSVAISGEDKRDDRKVGLS